MDKRGESLDIKRVTIKETRIGCYAERHFSKSKMTLKHSFGFLRARQLGHGFTLLRGPVVVDLGTPLSFPCPTIRNTMKISFAVKLDCVAAVGARRSDSRFFQSNLSSGNCHDFKKKSHRLTLRLFIVLWMLSIRTRCFGKT